MSALLCPECLSPLVLDGGSLARCSANGRRFRVLFKRPEPAPSPPRPGAAPAAVPSPPGIVSTSGCVNHLLIAATATCTACGAAICVHCDHVAADDRHLCPGCALGARVPAGATCATHAGQPAVALCASCGSASCTTCDFVFPGDLHVCPRCVEKPRTGLSAKRKRSLVFAYLLAVLGTLGLAVTMSGALLQMTESPAGERALEVLFTFFVLLPGAAGLALGVGSLDGNLRNPPVVWGAAIWNGIVIGLFILFAIIGTFMS